MHASSRLRDPEFGAFFQSPMATRHFEELRRKKKEQEEQLRRKKGEQEEQEKKERRQQKRIKQVKDRVKQVTGKRRREQKKREQDRDDDESTDNKEEEEEQEEEASGGNDDVHLDPIQSVTDATAKAAEAPDDDHFDKSGQHGPLQQQRDKSDDNHHVAEPAKSKENPKEFKPDDVDPRLQWGHVNCKVEPGKKGCNEEIMEVLSSNKELAKEISEPLSCDYILTEKTTDRPWQRILAFICRPKSVIERLLVHWQLGSGKTIGMIRMLENFWDDPRPKIILFPTDETMNNTLEEIVVKIKNRYIDAYDKEYREDVDELVKEVKVIDDKIKDHTDVKYKTNEMLYKLQRERREKQEAQRLSKGLEELDKAIDKCNKENLDTNAKLKDLQDKKANLMQGKIESFVTWLQKTDRSGTQTIGPFASPVTFLSYHKAALIGGLGKGLYGKNHTVTHPALVWNARRKCPNPKSLDNAIVIADEAHYISDPTQALERHVQEAVSKFKKEKWIQNAKNSVVVLFTATPISGGIQNYMDLMTMLTQKTVTKETIKNGATEGFALHMMSRDPNLFVKTSLDDPKLDSRGLPTVVSCPIKGDALCSYVQTRFYEEKNVVGKPKNIGTRTSIGPENRTTRLIPYIENVPVKDGHNVQVLQGHFSQDSWHDKKATKVPTCNWPKNKQLDFISKYATKLDAVAKHISETDNKMLVFMQKSSGMRALRALVHCKYNVPRERVYFIIPKNRDNENDKQRKSIKNQIKDDFNKRMDGKNDYRVLVLPAPEFQVSVSFFGVREVCFVSLGNDLRDRSSWDALNQQLGRAIRACSHSYIDPNKTGRQWYDEGKDITKYINFYLFVTTIRKKDLQDAFPGMDSAYIDEISKAYTVDEARFNSLVQDKDQIETEERLVKEHSIVVDRVVEMAKK